jgi:hypothetical protein
MMKQSFGGVNTCRHPGATVAMGGCGASTD